MFSSTTGLENTKKLTWNAKHLPLSVSVCSNVPEYDQPKCFVTDRDSKQLVKEMVDYLVEISSKSYGLMKEEFFSIFEAIDQKLEELKQKSEEPTTEIETQEDSDDEGEDLMESDGEEEEGESETEEDRAFIDDEVAEDQGASFYRAFDHERAGEEVEEYLDTVEKPNTGCFLRST